MPTYRYFVYVSRRFKDSSRCFEKGRSAGVEKGKPALRVASRDRALCGTAHVWLADVQPASPALPLPAWR
jgi:hypothetical protein